MTRAADQAFREFASARAPSLHRAASLMCGDPHLADDIVQETLAKCFVHWRRVRSADNPEAYAQKIMVNELRRHWRKQRRVPPQDDLDNVDPSSPDTTGRATDRLALRQALQTLPPRQRETIVLRYLEGLSEQQTARVLGCSIGTVKSQTARALRTLEKFFQREEIQP